MMLLKTFKVDVVLICFDWCRMKNAQKLLKRFIKSPDFFFKRNKKKSITHVKSKFELYFCFENINQSQINADVLLQRHNWSMIDISVQSIKKSDAK